jgi:glycosyltransferase involved in cell wall biosynthesis
VLSLSVSIVCKDNAATIGRTLESVRGLGTEIVAVDSGSSDGTVAMLVGAGARVIPAQWNGYVATKQFAMEACTGEWVLSLDSDESLTPELRRSIEAALGAPRPGVDGYLMNRKVFYRNRPLSHVWQPEHRLRLVRRAKAFWTGMDPHDRLELTSAYQPGFVAPPLLAGDLRHDSISTFTEFIVKNAGHARTMAASLAAAGERGSVLRLVTSPAGAFFKQVVLRQAWRDGWPGWLAAASTAAATLMKHVALIELTAGGSVDPATGSPPNPRNAG